MAVRATLSLALCATLAAGCGSFDQRIDGARRQNLRALTTLGGNLEGGDPDAYVVVQRGEIAARNPDLAKALEEAAKDGVPDHRFVFRPMEAGPRLYRLAFVPEGRLVVGGPLLEELGVRVEKHAGGVVTLSRRTKSVRLEPGLGRLPIIVKTPDAHFTRQVDAWVDPDFDGFLLLDNESALGLRAERYEIPGSVEVEVPFGRPFMAYRVRVLVELPELGVSGTTEFVYRAVRVARAPAEDRKTRVGETPRGTPAR